MVKEKAKKAGGRLIGMWKQDAIAANPGASDEDLAKIINEMARLQGYDYTIAPSKVRTKTTRPAAKSMSPAAPSVPRAPARLGELCVKICKPLWVWSAKREPETF